MKQSISNLKLAERGAIISISTYLLLSAAKLLLDISFIHPVW